MNADCLTRSITKKRHPSGKTMAELFLVMLGRKDILSGHILKQQKRSGELSHGTMWKKAPIQKHSSFHPNLVIRNKCFNRKCYALCVSKRVAIA